MSTKFAGSLSPQPPSTRLIPVSRRLVLFGGLSIIQQASRGFSVLLWQDAGLGYALVSDVNRRDLMILATRINREP
jgi:hypothetical protein